MARSEHIKKAIANLTNNNNNNDNVIDGKVSISYQQIIDSLVEVIIENEEGDVFNDLVTKWTRDIEATRCDEIQLIRRKPSWKVIEAEFKKKHNSISGNNNDESTTNPNLPKKTSHTTKKKLNTSSLNHGITEEEKARVQKLFDEMDKSKLWILEETKRAAANEVVEVLSVEEKILKFASSCNFRHPSQLFILDLTDKHWENVFTQKEIQELEETGDKVLVPVDDANEEKLNELNELNTAEDVYNYSRTINHNPKEQPWQAWFTMTLMKTAYQFIHNVNISTYLESDKQYLLWGLLNDIFTGSNIAAHE